MSVYAFDFGGVLETSDIIRGLANTLLRCGHECHVISAIGPSDETRVMGILAGMQIPFTKVHFVILRDPVLPDGVTERWAGREKGNIMLLIGAFILIDDNPYICEEVRKMGLIALQHKS